MKPPKVDDFIKDKFLICDVCIWLYISLLLVCVAREYTIGDTSALYEEEYNDNGERIRGERLFTRATID